MKKFELATQSAANALVSLLGRAPEYNNKRAGHRTVKWYVSRDKFAKIRAWCKSECVPSEAYTLTDNSWHPSGCAFILRVPLDCKRPGAVR